MKIPAGALTGATLSFGPWISPRAVSSGLTQDDLSRPSARAVIQAAGASATCERFRQPIDHKNPSFGGWNQVYCVNPQYWEGPGSPVILTTPGENPISSYVYTYNGFSFLSNTTITGAYAEAVGAAVVVVEHRYFGGSSPYDGLNSNTLQYLTMEQAASDMVNFAQNVVFPWDPQAGSVASKTPWIYFGTGYAGTLGSWIEHFHPGVFYGYHLSGASVEVNTENWYYYDTIRKGIDAFRGDTECTRALSEVVDFVDQYLLAEERDEEKIDAVKKFFGASFPIEDDDFAYAIATPFRYWQETGGYRRVLDMCDGIVGSRDTVDDPDLGTIPPSVVAFAGYFRMHFRDNTCTYLDTWGQDDPLWCVNTHDIYNPFFISRTLGNPWRTWYWFLCNEPLASWATGAPPGQPSIVSRKIVASYWQRQCEMHFPPVGDKTYGSSGGRRTPASLNQETGGWLRRWQGEEARIIWTNGEFDPWRETSMASENRPGGPLQSSGNVYSFVIKNASHADDAFTARGMQSMGLPVNPEVVKVQEQAIEIVKKWVAQGLAEKGGV
ncbi:hypothetical protein VTJ04DRAFT_1349 [Mycothermus thermophilus]|uniref:uncharacterized protein n=1 Tax=Humicola insolens TaxID=85995 RepID=UPI003743FF77